MTLVVLCRKWMDSQSHGTNFSQFRPNSIADVFAKFADAKTFGLDGFCHGPTPFIGGEIFNYDYQTYGTCLGAFKLADKFYIEARDLLKRKGIKRCMNSMFCFTFTAAFRPDAGSFLCTGGTAI